MSGVAPPSPCGEAAQETLRFDITPLISEIGASLMVGGNIKGQPRVLTTATVLETSKGNFDLAIALSANLLLLIFLVNWALTWIQQRRPRA